VTAKIAPGITTTEKREQDENENEIMLTVLALGASTAIINAQIPTPHRAPMDRADRA